MTPSRWDGTGQIAVGILAALLLFAILHAIADDWLQRLWWMF